MTDATDLAVINNALARIGEGALVSRTDNSDLAEQVNAVFGDVVQAAHAAYPWKWARTTSRLVALAPPVPADPTLPGPFNGWAKAYSFPAGALSSPLGLYQAWPDAPLRSFQVEGRTVYAADAVVFATFIVLQDSGAWPPLFRLGVTQWLAAELAIPVANDDKLAATLMQQAIGSPAEQGRGGTIGRAIAVDVAQGGGSQASVSQSDPLTTARYGGGSWCGGW